MIPDRSLSRDNSGNGVSCRVGACRKRLRTIRANKRAQLQIEIQAQSEEIPIPVGRLELDPGILQARTEGPEEAGIT